MMLRKSLLFNSLLQTEVKELHFEIFLQHISSKSSAVSWCQAGFEVCNSTFNCCAFPQKYINTETVHNSDVRYVDVQGHSFYFCCFRLSADNLQLGLQYICLGWFHSKSGLNSVYKYVSFLWKIGFSLIMIPDEFSLTDNHFR